jgi:hypothetical protein
MGFLEHRFPYDRCLPQDFGRCPVCPLPIRVLNMITLTSLQRGFLDRYYTEMVDAEVGYATNLARQHGFTYQHFNELLDSYRLSWGGDLRVWGRPFPPLSPPPDPPIFPRPSPRLGGAASSGQSGVGAGGFLIAPTQSELQPLRDGRGTRAPRAADGSDYPVTDDDPVGALSGSGSGKSPGAARFLARTRQREHVQDSRGTARFSRGRGGGGRVPGFLRCRLCDRLCLLCRRRSGLA